MILEKIAILRDLTFVSILLRTMLAMVLSGILGYEREKRHRPAGFRTYLVVCLGSTLAMMGKFHKYDQKFRQDKPQSES